MSVYIKGMEMPTHCMDCPFMVSRDNDDCILQSDEANENFENWEQMKLGCPLVPVPEHGDLIDRNETVKTLAHDYAVAADIVREMPTIIPTDKEGNGNVE